MNLREKVAVAVVVVIILGAGVELLIVGNEVSALQTVVPSRVQVVIYMPGSSLPFRSIPVALLNVTLVYRHTFQASTSNRSVSVSLDTFEDFATPTGFNFTTGRQPVPSGVLTKVRLLLQTGTITNNAGTVFTLHPPGNGTVSMPLPFSLYAGGFSVLTITLLPNATQISPTDFRFSFSYSLKWVESSGGVVFVQTTTSTI